MAVSRVGPCRVERALATAPVPRPPQPTSAMFTTPDSPACTCGKTMPANADAAATLPVVFIMSRRDTPFFLSVIRKAPYVYEKTIAPGRQHRQILGWKASPILAQGRDLLK